MGDLQHTAFYIAHDGDKDWLIQEITEGNRFDPALSLSKLSGEIFSNSRLQYFINEEIRHDHFEIDPGNNNSLTRSSSGEQRKALLAYIISKNPGFIIIDNLFESLDKDTRQSISNTLKKLSASTLLLQIFSRKNELLPFIETIYSIKGRSIIACENRRSFTEKINLPSGNAFTGVIPSPIVSYEPQKSPLVKMNNVCVQFDGKPVLKDICWEINTGEFWQLKGPNGSGKSTLLSLITGNSPKGYGQDLVIFGNRKGTGETVWQVKQKIGYFAPSMTLQFERQDSMEQMIISGFFDSVGLYIKPSDAQVQLAREWLVLLGMYTDKSQPFRLFPEVRQRMILIARAMVKHPPLLILDEPTSGLDDEMVALFGALINKIAAETNTAILYVSHMETEGLTPDKIFELIPGSQGSSGRIQPEE